MLGTNPSGGHNFVKVVPGGYHRYFFGVKVKTVKLIGGTRFLAARSSLNVRTYSKSIKAAIHVYACPNHTDDGVYSDHGYLDTLDNPLGPPEFKLQKFRLTSSLGSDSKRTLRGPTYMETATSYNQQKSMT